MKHLVKRIAQLVATGLIIGLCGCPAPAHAQTAPDVCHYPAFIGAVMGELNAGFTGWEQNIVNITDIVQGPVGPETRVADGTQGPQYVGCIGTLTFTTGASRREYWGYYLNSAGNEISYMNLQPQFGQ